MTRKLIWVLGLWFMATNCTIAFEKKDIVISRTNLTLTATIYWGELPYQVKSYVFPVGLGKLGIEDKATCTPKGTFKIRYKTKNPRYCDIGIGAIVIAPYTQDTRNKYGTRIMGLSYKRAGAVRGLAIHGTNEPDLIPGYISNMCIRMRNEDIEILYELLSVGDVVTVTD